MYRYFDKHGPLKHLNKQLLDRYYNESLPGVRLWNELVISTNSDVNGIRIHVLLPRLEPRQFASV